MAAAVTRRSADLCYAELRLKLAVLCEVGIIRTSMCQGDANRAAAAAAVAAAARTQRTEYYYVMLCALLHNYKHAPH